MKKILVFGAGRSAWFTIHYIAVRQQEKNWKLTVVDASEAALEQCRKDFPDVDLGVADVHNADQREELIQGNDIIISLLPARFHNLVALDCIRFGKHLITPSYITPEIKALEEEAKSRGLVFLNELGLDPGIDHMSAMQIIHRLQAEGYKISSFKSYTGGLVAPESDTNPWHYKISWNPYNIIRAGQDGAICRMNGRYRYLPYNRLFSEAETITTPGAGSFDAYLNRNSLPYMSLYGLEGINTFIRGTLRHPGFCRMWQFLVNSGITSDRISMEELNKLSWKDFFAVFMPVPEGSISDNFREILGVHAGHEEIKAIEWLNFFLGSKVPLVTGTPAQVLQALLEEKWAMHPGDKDRVVMIHEFEYNKDHKKYKLQSVLDLIGEDSQRTAMARTVGLPLAIAAELIAEGEIKKSGVLLPVIPEVYQPLMKRLEDFGIAFSEYETEL